MPPKNILDGGDKQKKLQERRSTGTQVIQGIDVYLKKDKNTPKLYHHLIPRNYETSFSLKNPELLTDWPENKFEVGNNKVC